MAHQLQHTNAVGSDKASLPTAFITVCIFVFIAGVLATAYFFSLMGSEMEMPGGWTMSMMWMRMPGQTWFTSGVSFLLMWLAMMVAMMMPSALPMFVKTQLQWKSLCYMAFGYFAVWFIAGVVVYPLGVTVSMAAMQYELLGRSVPLISGALLIAVGVIQFTRWKFTHLLRCRTPLGCVISCLQNETGFKLGCKQGAACCACCAGLMAIQLVLGIMNPLVMMMIAIVIAAEKLLPRPEITTRLVGIVAIFAGITTPFY